MSSQFSRSLKQSVMVRIQKHATTYIRISQHTRIDNDIVQLQVLYCGELRNETLYNAMLAFTIRDVLRVCSPQDGRARQYKTKRQERQRGIEGMVGKQGRIYIY